MKCLLCQHITNDKEKLKQHYVEFHKVDQNNLFFKRMIDQKKNIIHRRKCNYCSEFVFINKGHHDFLKHYGRGNVDFNVDAVNDKPVDITNAGGVKKIEVT